MKFFFTKSTIAVLFCTLLGSTALLGQSNNRSSGVKKEVVAGIKVPIDNGNTTIFYPEEPLRTNKGNGRLDRDVKKAEGRARQIDIVANPLKQRNGKFRYEFQGIIVKGATMVKPGNLVVFQSSNGQCFAAARIGNDGRFKINIDSDKDMESFLSGVVVVGDDEQPIGFNYCKLPMDKSPPLELLPVDDCRMGELIRVFSVEIQK